MSTFVKEGALKLNRICVLGLTTALVSVGSMSPTVAQNCEIPNGTLEEDCQHTNAGTPVPMPTQPNVELEDSAIWAIDGYEISVDGDPIAQNGSILKGKKGIIAKKRLQDLALAEADISIKFDGLDVRPRLDAQSTGGSVSGGAVTFRNDMNYPAFVSKGEIRIIDTATLGGDKTIAVVPMAPNTSMNIDIPAGDGLVYVYRVYDARGRFDETAPTSLYAPARRGLAANTEEGTDSTAIRRIPVNGGAVTVSGKNVGAASAVRTLGETVRADGDGTFVLQRILPSGNQNVTVETARGERLTRDFEIRSHDLFYVGIVDVTVGKSLTNDLEDATGDDYDDVYTRGRVAFYLKGKVKGDYLLTAAVDTGEDEIGNLLKNLDEKNARAFLDRIDPNEYYPVYGDDSTSEQDARTAGKFYVRLEKDASHVMWGNFQSEIVGTEYLRNERTLYGAQAVYRSPQQTGKGQSRVEVQAYAAQPDTLPQRDIFLGTGGSTYFLKYQDITRATETILVEIQNPTTGQIVERRTLVYGVDYDINYVQGLVTLRSPLSSSASSDDLIVSNPNGDNQAFLVVNYEHTPTSSDVDAFSYGGRVQVWANDNLRLGMSAHSEDLGTTEQDSIGADILYQVSERTFVEVEIAETDGTGTGFDASSDGGLTNSTVSGVDGKGRAVRIKAQADLEELGSNIKGVIGGYYEDREEGFSTLSYMTSVDEVLWGIHAQFEPNERLRVRLSYDDYENDTGAFTKETAVEVAYKSSDALTWELGVEHFDKNTPGDADNTGDRIDVAAKLTYSVSDNASYYGYIQSTVDNTGGLDDNDRFGIGMERQVSDKWRLSGEVSDGTTGFGARALATYEKDSNNSTYFGYTLDPDREFGGVALTGHDKGSFVVGARRKLNDSLNVYAENTYDLFGEHKSLTSTYGADYAVNDYLTVTAGLEVGRVNDSINNTDFDRTAISVGSIYRDEDLSLSARLEFREDKGVEVGSDRDSDTIAGSVVARYKINEESRLLFSLEGVRSQNASESINDAKLIEGTLGYAYRPIDNDRLNILAKYTYLYDMTERTTEEVSVSAIGSPRQKAHVFSIDASYDINNHWTVGGKIGGRWSEQDNGDGAGFVDNNATLGVLNLRYHAVHEWDALIEARRLDAEDAGTQTGYLGAVYKHFGNNAKVGIGYNFGEFSDDLTDVTYDDKGVFINLIAKF